MIKELWQIIIGKQNCSSSLGSCNLEQSAQERGHNFFFSNTSQPWLVNDFFFLKTHWTSWSCKDCMFSMNKRTSNGQMVINGTTLNITNFVRLPNKHFLSHYSINCEQARQEKSSHHGIKRNNNWYCHLQIWVGKFDEFSLHIYSVLEGD